MTTTALADYNLIVPQKPSGGTSVWAQIVVAEWEKHLGEKINLIYKPGAKDQLGPNEFQNELRFDDKTIRIWDATGREGEDGCLRVFKGDSEEVTSIAILNDSSHQLCKSGLCIVSGSKDKTIRIWDATGREGEDGCLRVFAGHSGPVESVAILNDPSHQLCKSGLCIVSSGSWDKTVRIWDAVEGTCLFVNTLNSEITSVDIFPVASTQMKHRLIKAPPRSSAHHSSSCRKNFSCVAVGLKNGGIRVLYA